MPLPIGTMPSTAPRSGCDCSRTGWSSTLPVRSRTGCLSRTSPTCIDLRPEPSPRAFRAGGNVPVPLGGAFVEREDPAAELRACRLPGAQQARWSAAVGQARDPVPQFRQGDGRQRECRLVDFRPRDHAWLRRRPRQFRQHVGVNPGSRQLCRLLRLPVLPDERLDVLARLDQRDQVVREPARRRGTWYGKPFTSVARATGLTRALAPQGL